MKSLFSIAVLMTLMVFVLSGCKSSKPEIYPMPTSYPSEAKPWVDKKNDYLTSVVFNSEIDASKYTKIVVLPIDQKGTLFFDKDAVEKKDMKAEKQAKKDDVDAKVITDKYMKNIDSLYWGNLKTVASSISLPMEKAEVAPANANVVVLMTRAVIVDAGSQAARYWISFGAGATKLQLEFTLVDGTTGKTLLTAVGEDRGLGGSFGGDSYELLQSNMEEVVASRFSVLMSSIFKKAQK